MYSETNYETPKCIFDRSDIVNAVAQNQSNKPLRYVFQKTAPNKIPYGNNPNAGLMQMQVTLKIYYEIYGQGEPFVLLHGSIFGATIEMGQLIDTI